MTTKVYHENTFSGPEDVKGGGTVTVEHDAYIITDNSDNGIEVYDGPWTFKIDGYLQSQLNGIAFYDTGITKALANSKITVGTEGTILSTGAGFSAITTTQGVDVVNSGRIEGAFYGIQFHDMAHSSSKAVSITNNATGIIRGSDAGIFLDDANHDLILKNAGVIGDVYWGRGSTIINSGSIGDLSYNQPIFGTISNNTITNSGTINQDVNLGQANDVINNSGEIHGLLLLYDGNNTVTNSGDIGSTLSAGSGNDTLTNSGEIGGYVHLSGGTNKVTNSGSIFAELILGSGNDTVGNTGTINGAVDLLDGKNALVNSGTIGGPVSLGFTGDDLSTLTNKGEIQGYVAAGKNNDLTVTNTKLIDGSITVVHGALSLTNSGVITGDVHSGLANHKITNSGTIGGDILLGGANTIINSGTIDGPITTQDGDDTLTNTKLIAGDVSLGDGKNTITNSGTISGTVTTGNDADVVKNTGLIFNVVQLGGGNDKFTGGNFAETVDDANGDDVYSLGGGDDTFIWEGLGNDAIDGGAGSLDALTAIAITHGVAINLDTKAVKIGNTDLAASSAFSDIFSISTVKGFEFIVGSTHEDIIAGSNANEKLIGQDGADVLFGGGGKDDLNGGSGVDTFVYHSTKDSGNTKATRDTIEGFEGAGGAGGDKIDLSRIDANTKTAIDDAFHLLSVGDVAFDLTPGCLRWVHEKGTTDMTILQGDVNGDGKADFAIAVVGTVNFIAGDFSL